VLFAGASVKEGPLAGPHYRFKDPNEQHSSISAYSKLSALIFTLQILSLVTMLCMDGLLFETYLLLSQLRHRQIPKSMSATPSSR
jgi:hypothetical protein